MAEKKEAKKAPKKEAKKESAKDDKGGDKKAKKSKDKVKTEKDDAGGDKKEAKKPSEKGTTLSVEKKKAKGTKSADEAEVANPLPAGWVEETEASTQRTVYVDAKRKLRQYTRPYPPETLEAGWTEQVDEANGRLYFVQDGTGATQWERPQPQPLKVPAPMTLPTGWTSGVSGGRTYYRFKDEDGFDYTTWKPPNEGRTLAGYVPLLFFGASNCTPGVAALVNGVYEPSKHEKPSLSRAPLYVKVGDPNTILESHPSTSSGLFVTKKDMWLIKSREHIGTGKITDAFACLIWERLPNPSPPPQVQGPAPSCLRQSEGPTSPHIRASFPHLGSTNRQLVGNTWYVHSSVRCKLEECPSLIVTADPTAVDEALAAHHEQTRVLRGDYAVQVSGCDGAHAGQVRQSPRVVAFLMQFDVLRGGSCQVNGLYEPTGEASADGTVTVYRKVLSREPP